MDAIKNYFLAAAKNSAPELNIKANSYEKSSRTHVVFHLDFSADLPGESDTMVAGGLNKVLGGSSEDPLAHFGGQPST